MKIILSRKGFDSGYGKKPSPILPDGTMLSLPIPGVSSTKYSDLEFHGMDYLSILESLGYDKSQGLTCHLDPDLREGLRKETVPNWKAAFGQEKAAQTYLNRCGVDTGDLFLFFGWFKKMSPVGCSFYETADLHVIYGYMQVGAIITDESVMREFYPWHPHSEGGYKNNALYIPSDRLVIDGVDYGKGYGTFTYHPDRVLTKENCSRAHWVPHPFLMPGHILGCNRKNSASTDTLYYKGQWQEIVFDADNNPGIIEWLKQCILV